MNSDEFMGPWTIEMNRIYYFFLNVFSEYFDIFFAESVILVLNSGSII